jgi:Tfp pilus assembly PilM family ATPase
MPIVIELKSNTINIVEARVKSNVFDLRKSRTVSIPEEWIDVQGIKEMDDLYLLLSSTMDEENFRMKDAILCINNASVIYRELIIPNIDKKKMAMIVRSEMMDVLNLTPDYIMDYVVIEEFNDDNERPMVRLLAVASISSALESYITLMKRLKLKLTCIDTATNSVIKLVDNVNELKSIEQLILVDIGNKYLRLYLFELGKYILTRNAKLVHLNESSDEEVKNIIEDNINKMVQFSFTRVNKTGNKKIVLAGRDELLEELKAKVLNDLLVPCEILAKPDFLSEISEFETCYINAVGALIRK